ncbi:hypothetical protein GCM10010411_88800 [Actinomadura fulvescens]|uniref:DUF4105 domain-containing protein n=1 Tax=Actinomadura fulvescens TaxID=46160 RepID=A0ABN3QVN2_9ACTN
MRRAWIVVCALVLVTVTSEPVRASTLRSYPGRACVFYAPFAGIGHVGWAVLAENGQWYGGATESTDGWPLPPGRSWLAGPYDWPRLLEVFRVKRKFSPYRAFRCRNVRSQGSAAALARFRSLVDVPYHVFTNNCLTRTVRTLRAYSSWFGGMHSGVGKTPWEYYRSGLSAYGWEPSRRL